MRTAICVATVLALLSGPAFAGDAKVNEIRKRLLTLASNVNKTSKSGSDGVSAAKAGIKDALWIKGKAKDLDPKKGASSGAKTIRYGLKNKYPQEMDSIRQSLRFLRDLHKEYNYFNGSRHKLKSCPNRYGKLRSQLNRLVSEKDARKALERLKSVMKLVERDHREIGAAWTRANRRLDTAKRWKTNAGSYRARSGVPEYKTLRTIEKQLRKHAVKTFVAIADLHSRYKKKCEILADLPNSRLLNDAFKKMSGNIVGGFQRTVNDFISSAKIVYKLDCLTMRKMESAYCAADTKTDLAKARAATAKLARQVEKDVDELHAEYKALKKFADTLMKIDRVKDKVKKDFSRANTEYRFVRQLDKGAALGVNHPIISSYKNGGSPMLVQLRTKYQCTPQVTERVWDGVPVDCVSGERCTVYEFAPAGNSAAKARAKRRARGAVKKVNAYVSESLATGVTPTKVRGGHSLLCAMARHGKCRRSFKSLFKHKVIYYSSCARGGSYKCITR